jgi:hypothetical protein
MKTLIAALALATAISAPALAQTRHQVSPYDAYGQSRYFSAQSFGRQAHPNWDSNLNLQSRTTDPDPFVREYLRNDQPGNQWR